MARVTITVEGPVGSGKSALCKEIEILCRALGVPCEWHNGQQELNGSGGDSHDELQMYQPNVLLREVLTTSMSDKYIEAPVLLNFDSSKPIGVLRVLKCELPDQANFTFAIGYMALHYPGVEKGELQCAPYNGPYELKSVSIVDDAKYFSFLQQIGHRV